MAIGGFLRGIGEAVGVVKPRTKDLAGTKAFEELSKKLYQYKPEQFQVGPVSGAQAEAARQEMATFAETLRRRAAGEAPSLAEQQLKAGQQRQQQSLQAALAGLRGRQAGLSIRGLQQQFAEQGQVLSQQAAQLKAAEQAQAEQQLAQFLGQRTQAEMGAQEMAFREQLARQQAAAELERLRGADIASLLGLGAQLSQQARAQQAAGIGGLLSAGAGLGAAAIMSDVSAKKEIEPAKAEAKKFLDELTAYTFKYKNSAEPMMGIMAQDAEKSKMGKYMVQQKGSKKMLSGKKTMSAMLASLAYLNDRINQMEDK